MEPNGDAHAAASRKDLNQWGGNKERAVQFVTAPDPSVAEEARMKTHDKSYMSPEGRTKWSSAFGKTRWLGAQSNLTVPGSRTFGPPRHVMADGSQRDRIKLFKWMRFLSGQRLQGTVRR